MQEDYLKNRKPDLTYKDVSRQDKDTESGIFYAIEIW